MANRIEVAITSSIIVLRQHGWSFRKIAQTLGIHRETVSRYVRLHEAQSKPATNPPPGNLRADQSKPANPPAGNPGPQSRCEPFRDVIVGKLDQGLSAQRIWQDLVSENGFEASYTSVKRFVHRLGKSSPLPFRRMECPPGAEGQVDFGRGAPVLLDGRRRFPHVLRLVLSHSRKGHSSAVWRQRTDDFIRALEDAFWAMGGVPRTLIIDNLRAAVKRADWYDPELNPKIQAFCRHYGTVVLPAKPYTPRHKGKVEAGVKYVRNNALKGRVFRSLAEENAHLDRWERQVADHRIHGTTKKQVKQLFEEAEKPALLPLPATRFPFFHEAQRSVHRDAHVEVDRAYYSVPPEYLGHRVWVRWDSRLVRIFNGRMEQIAVHVKHEKGRFSTDPRHIASEKISGVERGAAWLLKRVRLVGPQTFRWAQAVLEHRGIQGMRVLQGLLAMTRKHPADDLEHACERALSHGAYRLRALRQLMKQPSHQVELVQNHPLIRPMDAYARHIKVSFRQEANGNGEFTVLGATGGKRREKGPERSRPLPAVSASGGPTSSFAEASQDRSALGPSPAEAATAREGGSLSISQAQDLSSEPAIHNLRDDDIPVNAPERTLP